MLLFKYTLVGLLSDKSLIVRFTTWEAVNIQQQFPVSNNNNVNEIMESNKFSRKRAMNIQAYSNNDNGKNTSQKTLDN